LQSVSRGAANMSTNDYHPRRMPSGLSQQMTPAQFVARTRTIQGEIGLLNLAASQAWRFVEPTLIRKQAESPSWTIANRYNERPTWLSLAYEKPDRAVLSAYAVTDLVWPEDCAEVWTDTGAGEPLPPITPSPTKCAEIEERVLANLIRVNLYRANSSAQRSHP
jgi:hypothetical protein